MNKKLGGLDLKDFLDNNYIVALYQDATTDMPLSEKPIWQQSLKELLEENNKYLLFSLLKESTHDDYTEDIIITLNYNELGENSENTYHLRDRYTEQSWLTDQFGYTAATIMKFWVKSLRFRTFRRFGRTGEGVTGF